MAMFNVISLNCNGLCDSNKRNCIFSLCNERFYDIICLQETFWNDLFVERIKRDKTIWDGDIFYSNSGNNRQGVAILVSKKLKNIFLEVENDNGRFIHIKGTINDKLIDIYNIYAPNNVNERYEFFLKCKQKISKGKYVLVAGDFNTTLSSLDKSGKTMHCNDKAVKSLCNFMQEKELYDIWRNRNVNTKVFSRKQVVQGFLTQSRIDYFLVSLDLKSCIKNIHYKDTSFSDHSIVSMKIDFCNVERGPGVWVFNNSFLQDELFIDKMKRLFANEIGSDFYVSNPLIWWDNLKFTIKRLSQIYGKEKQKDLNREYYKLQNKIQELSVKSANGIQINSEQFLELQTQLEDIETYKCQGAILRSKSQWALESDRNTAYFLKLEKYRQNKNVISEIKDCDGKIVTETNDLLDVIHDYYKHLFSCVSIDMHSVDELLNNVNVKIDDEDVEMCDDEISIEEIEKSLKGMKKGKTPGPDECDEVLQLLGIWVGKNKTLCEKLNWEGKVQSITKLLNFWKMRHLTLHGRVSVISALLMSKLWYTLMVVNIPEKYCILIKKKCLEFLWNNKPPLVAYEVIINKVVDGGLNFPDIMQKMYAFRLKYLSRLLDENYCAIWKQTCLYFFSKFENMNLGIEILFCDLRNRKIDALPEFYQSLILSWQSICENVDIEVNSENVFDIPLFLNPNITNGNKMLYLKTFIEAGVCKIKDIAYECKPGFLKESYIQEIVLEKFPEVSENKMLHAVIEKFGFGPQFVHWIKLFNKGIRVQ
ncbi:unnamed protein product [Mytilus edulis]|uniref:Endonuclease/exonuclease/phosphatase domain-containing protein n=1 Tax=Mytilus edulis TaxID=6550 RepID=A0A8S3UCN4_MYTED|nr:unnamed protein product [Mytilus edulis]